MSSCYHINRAMENQQHVLGPVRVGVGLQWEVEFISDFSPVRVRRVSHFTLSELSTVDCAYCCCPKKNSYLQNSNFTGEEKNLI